MPRINSLPPSLPAAGPLMDIQLWPKRRKRYGSWRITPAIVGLSHAWMLSRQYGIRPAGVTPSASSCESRIMGMGGWNRRG